MSKEKLILEKLEKLERDMSFIKERIMDLDILPTQEELRLIQEAEELEKQGRLTPLKQAGKRLGIHV